MAIVAPYSKHRTGNLITFAVMLFIAGAWFGYDGYFNKNFIKDHSIEKVDENGDKITVPDDSLKSNRALPPYLFAGSALFLVAYFVMKNKKVILEDDKIIIGSKTIAIDSIEKIDKTFFEKKGVFTISYKNSDGNEEDLAVSDRSYDKLRPVLDELINKIS